MIFPYGAVVAAVKTIKDNKKNGEENRMGNKAKFDIGDVVYNKVERMGSYEPSLCRPYSRLEIDEIKKRPNGTFEYVCTIDGYTFKENELMSKEEYKNSL